MTITVTGKHTDIGDALRTNIEQLVTQVSERYFGEPIEAHIVVEKKYNQFFIDFSVHISRNFIVRTHANHEDPYQATSQATERMETRIQRYKSRLKDRRRMKQVDEMSLNIPQYVLNAKEEDKGGDTPIVIAEMSSSIATLTVSEAVMRMDLTDQPVLMFKNASHDGLSVVYKRSDGNIGWIDPKIQSA